MNRTILTLFLLAITYFSNAQISFDAMEAYYPFNSNTIDYSGNNNNGVVNGPVLTMDRFGTPNSAYLFDGVNDYIKVADFDSIDNDDALTFSIWAKANKKTSNCMVMLYPDDNSNRCVTCAQFKNEVYWDYGDIINGGRMFLDDQEYDTLWHHYVFSVSFEDSIKQFYKDGELVESDTGNIGDGLSDKTRELWIGGGTDENPGNIRFNGVIDDIRIYSRRIDINEVQELYQESPCIGYITETIQVYDTTYVNVYDTTEVMVYDTTNVIIHDTTNITIYDTTNVAVYDSISVAVSDTLMIDFLVAGDNQKEKANIKVYPNPTSNQISIAVAEHDLLKGYKLKIVNASGAVLYNSTIDESVVNISLGSLGPPGIYHLNLVNEQEETIITKKILLQ